ncbi:MAG: SemiSWEET transporter [Candidatus Omnitrophica bacterium]|nr:SemiSWEET transporter [Candidatus Omnitrophota bacterium]
MPDFFSQNYRYIGILAAALTMFGFLPQIIKTYASKSAKDISLLTLLQFACGISLWIIYGIFLEDAIIITANSVTLTTLIVLLYFYYKYGNQGGE